MAKYRIKVEYNVNNEQYIYITQFRIIFFTWIDMHAFNTEKKAREYIIKVKNINKTKYINV